jgi:predicted esterase
MENLTLSTVKTAFYSTCGQKKNPKTVWFVLHGYGQLSRYFIRHFETVADEETLVVAPEAPSRFYLEGKYERVGASWMTKHERETEIRDLESYLNSLFDQIKTETGADRFVFLGFSQGVAVLCRWLKQRSEPIEKLILWAGGVPHDMSADELRNLMNRGKSYIVYGTEDPYLSESPVEMMHDMIRKTELPVNVLTFEGAHTLDAGLLQKLKQGTV